MRRIRFYKFLLPAVLLAVIVLLVRDLKPLEAVHATGGPGSRVGLKAKATGIRFVDMEGSRKKLEVDAGGIEQREDGRIDLEDVRELKFFRDGDLPVTVQAMRARIEGAEGSRTMTFEQEVVFEDPTRGLILRVPLLELDEQAAEARSGDSVSLEGEQVTGRATAVVYGLDEGQPVVLRELELMDERQGTLRAGEAVLHDGLDDVELLAGVYAERGPQTLTADTMRILRREDHGLQTVTAEGSVQGRMGTAEQAPLQLAGQRLDVSFDAAGDPQELFLSGAAMLQSVSERLEASAVRASRIGAVGQGWNVRAEGDVVLFGQLEGEPTWLRSAAVVARFAPTFALLEAEATGRVSLDSTRTRAEATRATYGGAGGARVDLYGSEERKARLARERMRVAAEQISTDSVAGKLTAERRVEASLLPATPEGAATATGGGAGMFDVAEAVHFVAARLEATEAGDRLTFRGAARGWQGERNLAADRISMDRVGGTLTAEGSVNARFPRGAQATVRSADYVQITSRRLDYDETERIATFRDQVRVLVAEGWVEGDRVEIAMSASDGQVEEIRAQGQVLVEFRQLDEQAPQLTTGQADRMVYRPAERTVWLVGEGSPASVRRVGEGQGTTTARVLLYRMDTGTLEVESGDTGPARIRASRAP